MAQHMRRWLVGLFLLVFMGVPITLSAQEPSGIESAVDEKLRLKIAAYGSEMPLPMRAAPNILSAGEEVTGGEERAPENGVLPFSVVAWQSAQDTSWDIRAAVESESAIHRVTRENTNDVNPAVRPGTYEVAYTRISDTGNSDIYRASATGSDRDPSPLITSAASDNYATYSGDGQWLYFASTRHGNWELYRANADGGDITRLTNDGAPDIMPAVSRDGGSVIWVRQISPTHGLLMRANADGSNAAAIGNPIAFLQHPKFSPDGTRIGFDGDINGNGWNDIGILTLSNGQVTMVQEASGHPNVDYWFGGWSPITANEVLYTQVAYVVLGGNLYIQSAQMRSQIVGATLPRTLFNDTLAMNGAWERTEVIAPMVTIDDLPEYSKALGFGVWLSGSDAGAAPLSHFEVQLSVNGGGWATYGTAATPFLPIVQPVGSALEIRARAVDVAGNYSPYTPPVSTRLYGAELTVSTSDALGYTHPAATFEVTPVPATIDPIGEGAVRVRHTSASTVTVETGLTNFETLPPAVLNGQADSSFRTYYPGVDNQILNGDFLQGTTSWTAGGDIPLDVAAGGHGDGYAASLCNLTECSEDDRNPTLTMESYGLTVSADDTVYLLYLYNNQFWYQTHTLANGWGEPIRAFTVINGSSVRAIQVHIARDNTLHITYADDRQLRYSQRTPNGIWSAPLTLETYPQGWNVSYDSALDSSGTLHVVNTRITGAYPEHHFAVLHRERTLNGTWNDTTTLVAYPDGPEIPFPTAQLLAAPDGTLHAWVRGVGHFTKYGGSWQQVFSETDPRSAIYNLSYIADWLVAPDGTLHTIFYQRGNTGEVLGNFLYAQYSPTTSRWSEHTRIPVSSGISSGGQGALLARGNDGTIWILSKQGNQLWLRKRAPDGLWTQPTPWRHTSSLYSGARLDFTAGGEPRLVEHSAITRSGMAESTQVSRLSQSVDLSGMHRPALAFMYRFEQAWRTGNGELTVTATNGVTETEIFSATVSPALQEWTLGSADLSLYEGESVTVTFSYEQPAGERWSHLLVDTVTVSSYRAPILLSATPSVIESGWVGETITVTGENFSAPLTVRVNGTPVTVTRIDDQTFTYTVPPGTRPGVQVISVTNGEAFENRRGLVRFGRGIFLPVVRR